MLVYQKVPEMEPSLLGLRTPLAAGCDFPRPHAPAATSPGGSRDQVKEIPGQLILKLIMVNSG